MAHCVTHPSSASEVLRETLKSRFKIDRSSPSGLSNLEGKPVGYQRKDGYWIISLTCNKQLLAHRIVWMLAIGDIPEGMVIDHIDRDPSNNLIENLRCVTQAVNLMNVPVRSHSRTGEKYISKDPRTGRYSVRIRRVSHGTYPTLAEAIAVRDSIGSP